MVRYNSGDEVIEIKVLDDKGGKLDARRANKSDSEANSRWLKWLVEKWGVKFKEQRTEKVDSEFLKY